MINRKGSDKGVCADGIARLMGEKFNRNVKNPKHYQVIDGFEAIDIIASSMTDEQFRGYCLGNIIKYRLRAGSKDSLEQDIAKANEYKNIYENKRHLCKGGCND